MISSKKKHPPELEDAPGFDGFIHSVFVYSQNLSQLIGCEYLKEVTISQHQQYLNCFLTILFEPSVEKLSEWLDVRRMFTSAWMIVGLIK